MGLGRSTPDVVFPPLIFTCEAVSLGVGWQVGALLSIAAVRRRSGGRVLPRMHAERQEHGGEECDL
jgi:hypothetical protein